MTDKKSDLLFKECFRYIKGETTYSDFQESYKKKFIDHVYLVDGENVVMPLEKKTFFTAEGSYEIKYPMEMKNNDYFTGLSYIIRDGLLVVIKHLKDNCKTINLQKIIDHETKESKFKVKTTKDLEEKENDLMFQLKFILFYSTEICNFFDIPVEYSTITKKNRNSFLDFIAYLRENRNTFAHQNKTVKSVFTQKIGHVSKTENITTIFTTTETIFTILSSKIGRSKLEFVFKNVTQLKRQFMAHLQLKIYRKTMLRLTDEQKEARKVEERANANEIKKKYHQLQKKDIDENIAKEKLKMEQDLKKDFDDKIAKLKADFQNEKLKLQLDLKKKHDSEIDSLKITHMNEKRKLDEKIRELEENAKEFYSKKLNESASNNLEYNRVKNALASAERTIKNLQEDNAKLQRNYEKLFEDKECIQRYLDDKLRIIRNEEMKHEYLKQDYDKKISELKNQNDILTNKNISDEKTIVNLRSEISNLKAQSSQITADYEKKIAELSRQNSTNAFTDKTIQSLKAEIQRLTNQAEKLSDERDNLKRKHMDELEAIKAQHAKILSDIKAYEDSFRSTVQDQINQIDINRKKEVKYYEDIIRDLNEKLSQAKSDEKLIQKIDELRTELFKKDSQIQALQLFNDTFQARNVSKIILDRTQDMSDKSLFHFLFSKDTDNYLIKIKLAEESSFEIVKNNFPLDIKFQKYDKNFEKFIKDNGIENLEIFFGFYDYFKHKMDLFKKSRDKVIEMASEIETLKEQLNYVQLENIRLSNYASHEFQEEGSHPEKRRSFFKKMFH